MGDGIARVMVLAEAAGAAAACEGAEIGHKMASAQVLPGIVLSPALGSMLREYQASCAAQPTGLGGSGAGAQAGGIRVGVTDAAVERNAGTRPRATSVGHQTPDDVALVSRRGQITEKILRDHFHLPLHTVAKMFGMCTTAFKKLCRRFEIPKWPHRQVAHAAPHP